MRHLKAASALIGAGVVVGLFPDPAAADSGTIYSAGQDCAGRWQDSQGNRFQLMDRAGGGDDDYCYIDYGGSANLGKRVTIPEDSSIGSWQTRRPDMTGIGNDSMYFKVCEERENDPDLCSSVHGPYATK
jgi:hypothetical protein